MLGRAILVFATLIALSQTATAGVALFGHVSCTAVRFYVAKYSEAAAETWARSHGASNAEIETARQCLHPASMQTANLAARQLAAVSEQERAQHEPAERDPDRDALRVVPVQGQRADPEQDNHNNESRPKDVEDRSVGHPSYEAKDDLVPSDGEKTTPQRPRYVGAVHRAHSAGVTWLKRLWDHLVGRRRSSIALFAFSRSYKARPPWHHLSGTEPGHGAG